MGLLDRAFSKIKPGAKTILSKNEEEQSSHYFEKAVLAADIVSEGVEKNDFFEMNRRLENITQDTWKDEYVFEYPPLRWQNASMGIFVVCSLVFGIYMLICLGTIVFSTAFRSLGLVGLLVSLGIVLLNVINIKRIMDHMRFVKRYEKYEDVLKHKKIEIIENLSLYSGENINTVIEDLARAIKEKVIPQGHFGKDNIFFMVSDEVYTRYLNNQDAYDNYFHNQIELKKRAKDRDPDIQKILDQGKNYVDAIHESNVIIKDAVISEKLDRMERIVSLIFREVEADPDNSKNLGMLLKYYLPTTKKLLDAYISADGKQIDGKSIKRVKTEIESSLDMINSSFENLLDKFYQDKELDIASDISVMKTLMKQEGLTDDMF